MPQSIDQELKELLQNQCLQYAQLMITLHRLFPQFSGQHLMDDYNVISAAVHNHLISTEQADVLIIYVSSY